MPDWKKIVKERMAALRLEGSAEADLAEELSQHLDDHYRELCASGLEHEQAFRIALSEMEDVSPLQRNSGRTKTLPRRDLIPLGSEGHNHNFADNLWRDVRYTARSARKSPAFVAFVVLTLALGIGANTTVFTVINTLLLNPLPVPNSSALQAVNGAKSEGDKASKSPAPLPISYADFRDFQNGNEVFQSLAGYSPTRVITWQSGAGSRRMFAELVTGNYFSTLNLNPIAGRYFLPDEDTVAGAHPVAVLNYGCWQASFGGARNIIGQQVRLNGTVFTIVGVAPPRFIGVNGIFGPDVWIPTAMAETLLPGEMKNVLTDRGKPLFQLIGRLKPGITLAQAQANMTALARNLARDYPAADDNRTAIIRPAREVLFASSVGSSSSIEFAGMGLLFVVVIVLLIACSNVANLLLARAAGRQQEVAVRFALGASRARVIQQLLTESILLALLSGVAGLMVGYSGLHFLFATLPSAANFIEPKFDAVVFLYALLVSLVTGFLFGVIPAFRMSDVPVAESLKEESRTVGRNRRKISFGNSLLVGQVALSFLLLVMATLFLRSIGRAYGKDPGFQTAHLAVVMANPGQDGYQEPQARAFYKDVLERVQRIPGVQSAAWASNLPLWARPVSGLEIEGHEKRGRADKISTILNTVGLGYFQAAGVGIENGREFNNVDRKDSLPVAMVNQELARKYWPNTTALGKRLRLPGETQMREVVGTVRNANYSSWGEASQPCVYVPMEQNYSDGMTLYVRTKSDPATTIKPVEQQIRMVEPHLLITSSRTGREIIDGGLFGARIGVALLTVFGLLALGLAGIGLYGILAYTVNQRRREIGLRMALGAARESVLRLILKQGMSLVAVGMLLGFLASLLAGRLLSGLLYGVSAADPISIAGAALVLMLIALFASYLPARRASQLDPLAALREG